MKIGHFEIIIRKEERKKNASSNEKSIQQQYDELKEKYEKLDEKYDTLVRRNIENTIDWNNLMKNVDEKREFILTLQNRIYELEEELIAKNKMIQERNEMKNEHS